MRKLVGLLIIILCLGGAHAHMENNDSYLYQSYDQLFETLGRPKTNLVSICIWEKDSSLLISAFSKGILTDYIEIDSNFHCLAGTIDEQDTTDKILQEIKTKSIEDIDRVYDIGSGVSIYAKISYDGYIVMWAEEYEGPRLYDYRNQEYTTVLFYKLKRFFSVDK